MNKRAPEPTSPPTERRAGPDRRSVDAPPPGGKRDRRRGLEARKPEVVELDMSPSDWAALSELVPPPPAPKKKP